MTADAHHNIRRLMAALEARRPLPADVQTWLQDGVSAYIAAGGRGSLDAALGLKGAGVRSLATIEARDRRNSALRAAMEYAHDGQPVAPERRADRLADEVERFRRKWPRLQTHDAPPPHLSALERHLFRAFSAGLGVPKTTKQIRASVGLRRK